MAKAVQVPGVCEILTGTGSAGALESMGYSINGVDVEEDEFLIDVPGDENGGDEGPPIDIQSLGQVHTLRFDLSKYDADVVAKLLPSVRGGTAGTQPTMGSLLFAGSLGFRVVLKCVNATNNSRNYLNCVFRDSPKGHNLGTKWKKWSFMCKAYAATAGTGGVIWNGTLT